MPYLPLAHMPYLPLAHMPYLPLAHMPYLHTFITIRLEDHGSVRETRPWQSSVMPHKRVVSS